SLAHFAGDLDCAVRAAPMIEQLPEIVQPTSRHDSHDYSPLCWSSLATSAVQPVWWLAPIPAPLSPWKYSWTRIKTLECGSSWNVPSPPNTGRRPSAPRRKIRDSRFDSSVAISASVSICPEPVGHSTRKLSPK